MFNIQSITPIKINVVKKVNSNKLCINRGNFQDFDKVNKIYKSYFKEDKLPARTCIGVTGLAVGASVEIDLIAKI